MNDRLIDEMIAFFNSGKMPKDLISYIEQAWSEHLHFHQKLGEDQITKMLNQAKVW